jgi:hypothetical protein
MSLASTISIFCGVSDKRVSVRRPVTTMLSTSPATFMTSRTGATSPFCGTSIDTRATSNSGIAASTS